MNQPSRGQMIGTYLVTSAGELSIDVTSVLSGRNDLSICLNGTGYTGYVQAASREGAYSSEPAPTLTWTYNATCFQLKFADTNCSRSCGLPHSGMRCTGHWDDHSAVQV